MKTTKFLRQFRPLAFVPGRGLLLARRYSLYLANFECTKIEKIGSIPTSALQHLGSFLRPVVRVLRLGIRYGVKIDTNQYLIAEKRRIWLLDLLTNSITLDHVVKIGSRPLAINVIKDLAGFDDCVCFGEYSENTERKQVQIWSRGSGGNWQVAYTFPPGVIEHIHAIIPDKLRGCAWILVGDFGKAAGIWKACDNFSKVTPVLTDDQEYRACWMGFSGKRIYYATDTQLTANTVRELILSPKKTQTASTVPLVQISGSSIYAGTLGRQTVFSTTVESEAPNGNIFHDYLSTKPVPGITSDHSDLVLGNPDDGFEILGSWRKDWLPWRLFEYGSINFPTGDNPTENIYAYFTSLKGVDGSMAIITDDSG